MGRLKGYVQRSLSFRPGLYKKLTERAKLDDIPNYAVVEAALNAAVQRGHIRKKVVRAVEGRKASISNGYRYIPVYVNEDTYRLVKGTAVTAGVPLYILMEEIIVRHLLGKPAYRKYVERHFSQGS